MQSTALKADDNTPALENFIVIEEGITNRLSKSWTATVAPVLAEVRAAVARDDFGEAMRLIDAIDATPIINKHRGFVETSALQAVLLGASQLTPLKQTNVLRASMLPPPVKGQVDFLLAQLTGAAQLEIKNLAIELIKARKDGANQLAEGTIGFEQAFVGVSKDDFGAAFVDALNEAVNTGMKVKASIASNLTTSRLITYGFLDEAIATGATEYQWSAVLDKATCPFCRRMHGRVFSVAKAKEHLDKVLQTHDVEGLKAISPFPKTDKASIALFDRMNQAQIEMHGWHVPPAHPNCRCVAVPKGSVPEPPAKLPDPSGGPDPSVMGVLPQRAGVSFDEPAATPWTQSQRDLLEAQLTPANYNALTHADATPKVSDFLRHCVGPSAFAEAAVCQAVDAKAVKAIQKKADKVIADTVVEKNTTIYRYATGEAATRILANLDNIVGSVLVDRGFITGVALNKAKLGVDASKFVEVRIALKKGQPALKLDNKLLLPSGSKLQVVETFKTDAGYTVVRTKLVDADTPSTKLPAKVEKPVEDVPATTISAATHAETQALEAKVVEAEAKALAPPPLSAEEQSYLDSMAKWEASPPKPTNMLSNSYYAAKQTPGWDKLTPSQKWALVEAAGPKEIEALSQYKDMLSGAVPLKTVDQIMMDPSYAQLPLSAKVKLITEADSIKQISKLLGEHPDLTTPWVTAVKDILDAPKQLDILQGMIAQKKAAADAIKAQEAAKILAKAKAAESGLKFVKADFKEVGKKPGGSAPGALYEDGNGDKWIIKYLEEDVARNELLSGKLYETLGVKVPELALVQWDDGKVYLASKMMPGFKNDEKLLASGTRTPGLYDNFVVDAYLSNWDAVGLSYDNIGFAGGAAVRIDVGGSLRYRAMGGVKSDAQFGAEVGELKSLRNAALNPTAAEVFKHVTPEDVIEGVRKVLRTSDTTLRNLVKQYGPRDEAINKKLQDTLIARKKWLAKEFPEATVNQPSLGLAAVPADRVTADEVAKVMDARLNGRVLLTDKGEIEDQSVLFYTEKSVTGEARTVVQLKVRPGDPEKRVTSFFEGVGDTVTTPAKTYEFSALSAKVEKLMVDWRKAGEKIGMDLIERADSLIEEMDKLYALMQADKTVSATSDIASAITNNKHFMGWLSNGKPPKSWYAAVPMRDVTGQEANMGVPLRPGATMEVYSVTKKKIDRGYAQDTGEHLITFQSMARTMTLEDGSKVQFIAARAPENKFLRNKREPEDQENALRNLLTITVPGQGEEAISNAFAKMRDMGLDVTRPTALDREELYLRRIINQTGNRVAIGQVKTADKIQDQAKRVVGLKQVIKNEFKVEVDKLPDYNPQGHWQAFDQGRNVQINPLVAAQPDWADFRDNHLLLHQNTSDQTMPELINNVLNSGGLMTGTLERYRKGIGVSTMSPGSDVGTGGADYWFTRIRHKDNSSLAGFYWKPDMLRRVDAISYSSDNYGRTDTEQFITDTRQYGTDAWRSVANMGGNETIFKGSIFLLENLEKIVVETERERTEILAIFKKHGIAHVDGKPVDEVVKLGRRNAY